MKLWIIWEWEIVFISWSAHKTCFTLKWISFVSCAEFESWVLSEYKEEWRRRRWKSARSISCILHYIFTQHTTEGSRESNTSFSSYQQEEEEDVMWCDLQVQEYFLSSRNTLNFTSHRDRRTFAILRRSIIRLMIVEWNKNSIF